MRLDHETEYRTYGGTVVLSILAQLGLSQELAEIVEDWTACTIVITIRSRAKLEYKYDPIKVHELVQKLGPEALLKIGIKASDIVEMTLTFEKVNYPIRPTVQEIAHQHSTNGGSAHRTDQSSSH